MTGINPGQASFCFELKRISVEHVYVKRDPKRIEIYFSQ